MSDGGYEEQLARLRRKYVVDARGDGEELRTILARAGLEGWSDEDRGRFKKLSHDLRGSGGAYGFGEITETAGALEDLVRNGDGDGAGAFAPALEALIAALDRALAQEGACS